MGLEFRNWMFIQDDIFDAELTYVLDRWMFWWRSPMKSTPQNDDGETWSKVANRQLSLRW